MGIQVEKMYSRILTLTWTEEVPEVDTWSLMDLMAEYIRRMAIQCQQNPSFFENYPFLDLAEKINPNVRADIDMVRAVRNHTAGTKNVWTPKVCEWALHFAALQDASIDEPIIKSPYEPLIRIFELEGDFIVKSEIWICGGTMFLSGWREKASLEPIVNLDD
jgi:hypothetical protein